VATYLFAFNPAIWSWPKLPQDIRRLARRGHLDTGWSCGRHRNIEPGSRAFFVRVGVEPRGIFGSGVTLTAPETRPHWQEERAAAGATYNRTMLRLERLFPLPLITFDELTGPPFGRFRWGIRSSGTYLPETIADALENLWEARVTAASVATTAVAKARRRKSATNAAAAVNGRSDTRPHGRRT
jgi:5-methylcytosine-specific restriction protein A